MIYKLFQESQPPNWYSWHHLEKSITLFHVFTIQLPLPARCFPSSITFSCNGPEGSTGATPALSLLHPLIFIMASVNTDHSFHSTSVLGTIKPLIWQKLLSNSILKGSKHTAWNKVARCQFSIYFLFYHMPQIV